MAIEVTSLGVEVVSKGIKEATDGLNALAIAVTNVEGKTVKVTEATDKLSDSENKASLTSSTYAERMKIKADLLGKNAVESASYMAAVKQLNDTDTQSVIISGTRIQAWKDLAAAQTEAIKMNNDLNKSLKDVGETEEQASARAKQVASEAIARVEAQQAEIAAYRDSQKALNSATQAIDEHTKSAKTASNQGIIYNAEEMKAEKQALASAKAKDNQTAAVQKLRDGYVRLLGQVDPFLAKFAKLDEQEQQLTASFKAGIGTLEAYNSAMAKISVARDNVAAHQMEEIAKNSTTAGAALDAFSLKSAAARRELMVMGRELARGDFGAFARSTTIFADRSGLMNAAVIALQSPITWLIAGIAAVGASAAIASQEFTDFNKQTILTGGYAGLSADQFKDMSTALGQIGAEGTHAAGAALTEVASSGMIAANNLEMVTKAAIELEETTGQKISATVKIFEDLQKTPVQSVLKLNETYHFLTDSVYEHIKTLDEEGNHQEASRLAFEAFSKAVEDRSSKIMENASGIEKAWLAVKKAVVGAANAILEINRGRSLDQQIEAAQAGIDSYKRTGKTDEFSKQLEDNLKSLQMQKQMSEENQAATNAAARIRQENVDAAVQIDKLTENTNKKYREGVEMAKLKYSLDHASASYLASKDIVKSADGSYSGSGYDLAVENIKRRNRVAGPRTNEYGINSDIKEQQGQMDEIKRGLDRFITENKNAYDVGTKDLQTYLGDEYLAKQTAYVKELALQDQIIELNKGKKNTAAYQAALNAKKKIQDDQVKADEDYRNALAAAAKKQEEFVTKTTDTLVTEYQNRQLAIDNSLAGADLGDKQKEIMKRNLAITQQYNEEMRQLRTKKDKGDIDQQSFNTASDLYKQQLDLRLTQEADYNAKSDALRADWKNGFFAAMDDAAAKSQDVAGMTKTAFTSAFSALENSLTTFVTTGKLSFSSFANSVLSDIARISLSSASSGILGLITSAAGAYFSGALGTAGGADLSNTVGSGAGQFHQTAFTLNAKGNAYGNNGVTKFANGGSFTNGIVDKPTMFANNQMGEAGPEAIVPLTRTADGALGVKSVGGGGSGGDAKITQNFYISDSGTSSSDDSTNADEARKALAESMRDVAAREIIRQQQQGGSLWKMKNGRS